MRAFASFDFTKKDLYQFESACEAAIRNIGRGTKKATIAACEEIMANSKEQVPKLTLTLLSSAFYEVSRRTDVSEKSYVYEATLGYGGNGDPVNYRTGKPTSYYMVAVHERLDTAHDPGTKAKFLEDPVREYAEKNFERTVFKYAKESLADMSD